MSRVTLGGLWSGMDTDSLINKILSLEQKRISNTESKKKALQEKQAAWGEITTAFSELRSKLDSLRLVGTYRGRSATLSDDKVASVTVSAGATLTSHSLSVSKLAKPHTIVSDADATSVITALNLSGSFKVKVGTGEYTVNVGAGDSLNNIRDSINAAAGGIVTAEVVKVQVDTGGGIMQDRYRLQLTSKTMGADSAITLTETTAGLLETSTGLGFFADGTAAVPASQVISAAQDAEFTLNGQSYKMPTNTVSDVINGVTFTLLKADAITPPSTTMTIAQDTQPTVDAVQGWVDELNQAIDILRSKTEYARDEKTGRISGRGVLTNDPLARQLLSSLKGIVSNVVTGQTSDLDSLYDIGVAMGAYGSKDYGKVVFDSTKLTAKLATNEDGVSKLFGALRTNLTLLRSNSAVTYAESGPADPDAAAYGSANAFNDITDPTRIGSVGGGWRSGSVPSPSAPQYLAVNFGSVRSIDQVKLYLPSTAATDGLKGFSIQYSNDSTDGINGTWTTISERTDNVSSFYSTTFTAVNAGWVRLKVEETNGTGNMAQVLEMSVLESTNAPGTGMYTYVNNALTSITGPIDVQEQNLASRVSEIDGRMEKMLNQLEKRENLLRMRFNRLEQAMAKLQTQGNALMAQTLGQRR